MEDNFIQVFLNSVKKKFGSFFNKLKSKYNANNLKNRGRNKMMMWFLALMDFRPKDRTDYYGLGAWLISKRLALFLVVAIGILGLGYFTARASGKLVGAERDGITVYRYSSMFLRFASGTVKIKSAHGDIAYYGNVDKGMTNGTGTLYYDNGNVMYSGDFVNNMYAGDGTQYYPDGMLEYRGAFADNLPNGEGISYRENGSREYEGTFLNGLPEGENQYYDSSDNLIYKGIYSKGNLLYTDLLGKSSSDISEMYSGDRNVYYDDEIFLVHLSGINAVYGGYVDENPLDDSISASQVYVLSDECYVAGQVCKNMDDVMRIMGAPTYAGNTALQTGEAVAIDCGMPTTQKICEDCLLKTVSDVDQVNVIQGYDSSRMIYIYTFEYENLQYTFYSAGQDGSFGMYLIQRSE